MRYIKINGKYVEGFYNDEIKEHKKEILENKNLFCKADERTFERLSEGMYTIKYPVNSDTEINYKKFDKFFSRYDFKETEDLKPFPIESVNKSDIIKLENTIHYISPNFFDCSNGKNINEYFFEKDYEGDKKIIEFDKICELSSPIRFYEKQNKKKYSVINFEVYKTSYIYSKTFEIDSEKKLILSFSGSATNKFSIGYYFFKNKPETENQYSKYDEKFSFYPENFNEMQEYIYKLNDENFEIPYNCNYLLVKIQNISMENNTIYIKDIRVTQQ